jgi:8-oxo-dGDP phosphatase
VSGPRDSPARWPASDTRRRFEGNVIAVRTDKVRMPDGGDVDRDVIEHPGAVGVLALDEAGRVLLVRQYRHPVRRLLWEPPAGLLDVDGEPALESAKRELWEEAHHRATDWRVLVDAFMTPGSSTEAVRIYLARGLTEVGHDDRHVGVHEEADMETAWVPLADVVRGALAGDLHNPLLLMGALAVHAALIGDGLDALRPADAPWPEHPAGPPGRTDGRGYR